MGDDMAAQRVVESIGKSEFEITPTGGIKTKGIMSWVVIAMLFILAWKYIGSGKAKKHVSGAGKKIKKIFKR